jgi:hypothetical protein
VHFMRLFEEGVCKSEYFSEFVAISHLSLLTCEEGLSMFTEQKPYPGVEGKTVKYVQTRNESDTLYFHIRFTDKTFLGISIALSVRVHSPDLCAESSGDSRG